MSGEDQIKTIVIQRQQGEISQEEFATVLLEMLAEPEPYAFLVSQILSELQKTSDESLTSAVHRIFSNFKEYRKIGQYAFSHLFSRVNQFLLTVENQNIRNIVSMYQTHEDPCVRSIVANCIIEWGDPSSFSIIEKALLAEDAPYDYIIAGIYSKSIQYPLSDVQIQNLILALRNCEEWARMELVHVSAESKDPRLVTVLTELLDDYTEPDSKWGRLDAICYSAASALGKIGTPVARQALKAWLEKEYQNLKSLIAQGNSYYYAGKLGDPRLIPVLAERLANITDASEEQYPVYALANFEHEEAILALDNYVRTWRFKQRTYQGTPATAYSTSVKRGYVPLWEAIKALGKMKSASSVSTIIDVLSWNHHPEEIEKTRKVCIHALRSIGTPEAKDVLKKILA